MKRRTLWGAGALGAAAALCVATLPATASSHREAPAITEDPVADITDFYMFASPDRPDTTTLVLNAGPMEEPAGGPNFSRFGDDVLYQFNIDNNGDAVADIQYQFRFTTTYTNPNTFLYNTNQIKSLTDPAWNVRQTYSVTEVIGGQSREIANNIVVPPWNIGPRSTPNYAALAAGAVSTIGGDMKVFAGPRDDPFFADLGSIFDLAGLRPFNAAHLIPLPTAPGVDYLAGYVVQSIVLQVPNTRLRTRASQAATPSGPGFRIVNDGAGGLQIVVDPPAPAGPVQTTVSPDPVIGAWTTTYRRSSRVLSEGRASHSGRWVQVSRLGMPLVNEVVVPIGTKDFFNSSEPSGDLQFAGAVLKPELAGLIPVLYPGVKVPTEVSAGLGLGGREDVATIFLTGIPGVNKPAKVTPSEMLRINTSTATGFPNGRLLSDDVVDTSLRVLAGATAFSPAFNISPNKDLGDGVNANDKPFSSTFPYLADPEAGYTP